MIITIHEYDNSIVAETEEGDKIVYKKKDDITFFCTNNNEIHTLTIDKFMGYYREIRIRVEMNGEYYATMILKRK